MTFRTLVMMIVSYKSADEESPDKDVEDDSDDDNKQ
jgi:hypothetical protein